MPNKGGGGRVSTAESSVDELDDILRSLASRLENPVYPVSEDGDGPNPGEQVLLDVEIGDVRLVAIRRGTPSPISMLSPREREIARMVALGYPNKAIASVLDISSWTVASHLRRVFMKLQVTSRAAMTTRLYDTGLAALPPIRGELHSAPKEPAVHKDPGMPAKAQRVILRRDPECVLRRHNCDAWGSRRPRFLATRGWAAVIPLGSAAPPARGGCHSHRAAGRAW
jgi:DNA-binding CsgD family transcriptional regulator